MATGIAFAEADVAGPDGTSYEGVQLNTRNNVLTLRGQDGALLLEAPGVSAVVKQSRKRWLVRLGPTVAFEVTRRDCGCGGSR